MTNVPIVVHLYVKYAIVWSVMFIAYIKELSHSMSLVTGLNIHVEMLKCIRQNDWLMH